MKNNQVIDIVSKKMTDWNEFEVVYNSEIGIVLPMDLEIRDMCGMNDWDIVNNGFCYRTGCRDLKFSLDIDRNLSEQKKLDNYRQLLKNITNIVEKYDDDVMGFGFGYDGCVQVEEDSRLSKKLMNKDLGFKRTFNFDTDISQSHEDITNFISLVQYGTECLSRQKDGNEFVRIDSCTKHNMYSEKCSDVNNEKKIKIGRNDKCFCGSDKKFKKCCLN